MQSTQYMKQQCSNNESVQHTKLHPNKGLHTPTHDKYIHVGWLLDTEFCILEFVSVMKNMKNDSSSSLDGSNETDGISLGRNVSVISSRWGSRKKNA